MAGEAGKEDEHEHPMCGVSIGKASNGQEKWGLVIGSPTCSLDLSWDDMIE